MLQDDRAQSSTLETWKQVKLTEPHIVSASDLKRECAYRLATLPDLKERLLVKPAAMKVTLKSLIPGPAADDVGPMAARLASKAKSIASVVAGNRGNVSSGGKSGKFIRLNLSSSYPAMHQTTV